jgi:serine/threonine protein kinase
MEIDRRALEEFGYRNNKMIGVGVFGRVYASVKDGKDICIKIIPLNKFDEREWKASELLRNKDCSNIIIYTEKLSKYNLILLEMEYMNGGDLKNYIDNLEKNLSTEEIYDIFCQICLYLLEF